MPKAIPNTGSAHSGEEGSIIVEFGLLFVPLLVVIVGIIEVALVLFAQQVLHTNTATAARLIGQGSSLGLSAPDTETALRSAICSGSLILVGSAACQAAIKVDLRVINSSTTPGMYAVVVNGSAAPSIFTDEGAVDDTALGVVNGVAGDSILVRAVLQLPSLTSFLPDLISFNGGQRIITAGAVVRIDPFAQYNNTGNAPAPAL